MSWDQLTAFAQSSPLLSIAFAGLTVAVIFTEVKHRLSGIAGLSPAQATLLMNREDALVVDVSPAADFAKAHIPGSISAPLADLDPEKHKQLSKAKDRPVIVLSSSNFQISSRSPRSVGINHTPRNTFKSLNAIHGSNSCAPNQPDDIKRALSTTAIRIILFIHFFAKKQLFSGS